MYHEVDIIQNTYNFLINRQKYIVLLTAKKKREKGEKEWVQHEIEWKTSLNYIVIKSPCNRNRCLY